jgi:hypothetical protein
MQNLHLQKSLQHRMTYRRTSPADDFTVIATETDIPVDPCLHNLQLRANYKHGTKILCTQNDKYLTNFAAIV